jgi:ribonuclease D
MAAALIKPVATPRELPPLLDALRGADAVCLDLEADSRFHYFEKLCLLQFTVPRQAAAAHFLLDTLAPLDFSPVLEVLRDKPLVLHGADSDLRILKRTFNFRPRAIFDTMLAARLAGHAAFGLDALVMRYTGKAMDQKMQKADWSQRPLPPRMLQYAVEDTAHLPLLSQKLREELSALGRLQWHRQQCEYLIEKCCDRPPKQDPEPWRIKGSFALDRRQLGILREIWLWREEQARQWNRPPYYVLSNETLLRLAQWAAQNPRGDLQNGPPLPPRLPPRRLVSLKAALWRGGSLPENSLPQRTPRGTRPPHDPHFLPRLKRLRNVRDTVAHELKLAPAIIATTAMLQSIASKNPRTLEDFSRIKDWLPWQTELLGEKFLAALSQ